MPLKQGSSKETISANIAELIKSGKTKEQAAAIAYSEAGVSEDEFSLLPPVVEPSARIEDINGFYEIKDNPISKVGVFPYSGQSIGADDPNKIYMVYRPEEELASPECIDSFKLVPIVDDHTMLGAEIDGLTPAEKKGVQGTTGEEVYFKEDTLYSNIKVFSDALQNVIDQGKKDISLGYRCTYEFVSGIFNGVKYDAVQRQIRGNHVAIVQEGRMGPEVSVLDHLIFTVDSKEFTIMPQAKPTIKAQLKGLLIALDEEVMSEEKGKDAEGGAATTMSLEELTGHIKAIEAFMSKLKPLEEEEHGAALDADKVDEEKAEDEDAEKKAADAEAPFEKKEGMDAAEVSKLIKADRKEFMKELSRKSQLAERLSHHTGAFDHSEMTLSEVEAYGVQQLNLNVDAGKEGAALEGFLAGKTASTPRFKVVEGKGQDKKGPSKLDAHFNQA